MSKKEYDAIVVGSGPNGLSAAITLQQQGLSVLLIEGKGTLGGGMRTMELTLPGYHHDVCAAIHPMAMGSPFFSKLPLQDYGLEFIQPTLPAAHPLDHGEAAFLSKSLEETAQALGADGKTYRKLIQPVVDHWHELAPDAMAPLSFPKHPWLMARFGLNAIRPASHLAGKFHFKEAKALWAGMAVHSIQPFTNWSSAAIALVLSAVGHRYGWPIPKGGSQSIANAMAAYFSSLGGKIETNTYISSLSQLPSASAVLFDVTPRQLLQIAG
ncbi:MAG TPA: NAD(P)/FAD-dependent oxidoreductase, partial [Cytophagales bacterium]|nr:NAD(P)/FAD-dependent oxidoreductase [Cytophagales bacterium]